MEKRFFIALSLSLLVLLFYSSAFQKQKQGPGLATEQTVEELKPVVEQEKPAIMPSSQDTSKEISLKKSPNLFDSNNLYNISVNGLDLTFSKKGAFLLEAIDNKHNTKIPVTDVGLVKEWADKDFDATSTSDCVTFTYNEKGIKISKIFKVEHNNVVTLTIDVIDTTSSKVNSYTILTGYFNPLDDANPYSQRYYEYSFYVDGGVHRKSALNLKKSKVVEGQLAWAGLRDRYFCVVLMPQFVVNKGVAYSHDKGVASAIDVPQRTLPAGASSVQDVFKIYIGPQDADALKLFGGRAEEIVNFGFFNGISWILLFLLKLFFKVTHNWGVAILLVSTVAYFALLPLSFKGMLSMKRMQALQPQIEALRTKHKDNAHKLNTEMMELYRKEKINPFGGCLPMLIQMPVFIALFQLLLRFVSLKGASFLWIKDLSEPDRLAVFSWKMPLTGWDELNILPILMAIIMFLQQKVTMASMSSNSQAAEQQKIMSIVMPVLFGFLFYRMPSGLVLYYLVNSIYMFGFQWKIAKIKV